MQASFDAFANALLLPKLAEVGWTPLEADGHLTRKLRGELIAMLPAFCAADAGVQAEARRRFDAFVVDPSCAELPSEYQQAVFKLVLKAGGEAEFEQLLHLFETLPLNEMKKSVLVGLGAAPTPKLRQRALEMALTEKIKLQDLMYIGASMGGAGAEGAAAAWAFFKAHKGAYEARLSKASASLMDSVIGSSARGFATEAHAADVRVFFAAHPMPRNERKIAQLLEAISTNAKYLTAIQASGAAKWLKSR